MRKLFSMIVAALVCVSAMAEIQRPKLVVGLVVDQMRWDYLYYYYDQYGEGGLLHLPCTASAATISISTGNAPIAVATKPCRASALTARKDRCHPATIWPRVSATC